MTDTLPWNYYADDGDGPLHDSLVGKQVTGIRMDEQRLSLRFNDGTSQSFEVDGDCCSRSYFYDITGAEKLRRNGPIVSARFIPDLPQPDAEPRYQEVVKAYGVEIVTDHELFGEQTTVISFRNDSNGYYGGMMYLSSAPYPDDLPDITTDTYTTEDPHADH